MGSHDPFKRLEHKLWPKEGLGIKLAVWLLTIKSRESPWFPCMQVACNILLEKALDMGYNFALDLISIEGLHTKLSRPKIAKVPNLKISGLPFGSLETKWHLGAGPLAKHRVYYKGEGGGFPQIRTVLNLVSLCSPMVHPCTKVLQLHTN